MKSRRRRTHAPGVEDAADPSARGPAHARLEPLVGLWDTSTRVFDDLGTRPVEDDGSVEKHWVLGRRFLREDLAGISNRDRPYMGLGFLGYDAVRRLYQSVWMSTGGTGVTTASGTIDETGAVLTLVGDEIEPSTGVLRRFRAILRIESDDRHVLTQSYVAPDGVYRPGFEIVYRRSGGPSGG